jgi:hypothetical protein
MPFGRQISLWAVLTPGLVFSVCSLHDFVHDVVAEDRDQAMKPTDTEVAARMRRYAIGLSEDATILAEMLDASGDGSRILSTLSMEILMKAVGLVESGLDGRTYGHDYLKLWQALDSATRGEVLQLAAPRNPGLADLSIIERALAAWKRAFVSGRYPYEVNSDRTDAEVAARGAAWVAAGSPLTEADTDFMYYPNEQDSLIFGMRGWLSTRIGPET